MKNLLNDQDALPKLSTDYPYRLEMDMTGERYTLPESNRQTKERWRDADKESGEDWRPYSPGVEINGKGQLRTRDYKPPEAEADIPIPCVTVRPFREALAEYKAGRRESYRAELEILGLSAEDIENELDELYPQAEPQTQPAIADER